MLIVHYMLQTHFNLNLIGCGRQTCCNSSQCFFAVSSSNHVNSICSMWGNFHFKTFDGDIYQFPGMCEYNLVSDCQSLIRQFSIYVKRTEHSSGPRISRVSITINDIAIELTENQVNVNEAK